MSEFLRVTKNGQILEIVLDKPKVNAICASVSRELGEIYAEFRDDPARRLADELIAAAPLALAAIKEVAQQCDKMSMTEFFEAIHSGALPAYHKALESGDAQEGINVFLEQREPSWKGS
jgi:enoyl-CoA hydratase/carnithine racemase